MKPRMIILVRLRIALLASGLAILAASAEAETQVFTDRGEFDAAVTAQKTIGFNGILPAQFQGVDEYFQTLTISGVTFSAPKFPAMKVIAVFSRNFWGSNYPSYPADYLTQGYFPSPAQNTVVISFGAPTYAFGLDYGGQGSIGFGGHGGSARFTLSNGFQSTLAGLPDIGFTTFTGWVSTDPITSVTLDVFNAYWVVENVVVATPTSVSTSPVFPLTVTADVTATTANVSASLQPRPQDVGTNASIFVFAHAPSNLVSGYKRAQTKPIAASPKDSAIVCVLAQVQNGQLVLVSDATMQAYLTGVLGSQQQAVTILDNVSTPRVAGATLFVGYGTSAASMLSSRVFETAILIPGEVQCTASLASVPAPNSPGALSGLWWNTSESGWGIDFTQRGSNMFAAWYTYDAVGKPKWYVSTCAGAGATSGSCSGTLYEVTGPAYFGATFNPSLVNAASAGNLQATWRDQNNATMTYTAAGQTRTIALTRQPLGTGTTPPAVDYTDLWWDPAESGWGMAMAQQFGLTFLAWYVYDANGKPAWLVSTCTMSGSSCSGTLYRTTGPPFGPTFNPAQVQATPAGTVLVSFLDANDAVLSYTVDGVSATKAITRQLF